MLDFASFLLILETRPKTEGTRPQAEISPSEAYSIGHPVPTWCFVPCASLVSRSNGRFLYLLLSPNPNPIP